MPTLPPKHDKQLLEQRRKIKQRQRQRDRYDPFLHTARWLELSDSFRKHNPLCERCKANGIIKAASEVHHVIPRDSDEFRRKRLTGFEWELLVSICGRCHGLEHNASESKENQEGFGDGVQNVSVADLYIPPLN